MGRFELGSLIDECTAALRAADPQQSVRDVVAGAVADPAEVLRALGEPAGGGITVLHRAPDLTILNVVWAPKMTLVPHDHHMWAVIGVYGGCEDNIFWKRVPHAAGGRVQAAGAKSLRARDAVILGRDIIHSVTNPIPRLTGALHVYGGDFFAASRSEWDPESLLEQPCDVPRLLRQFEDDNRRWFSSG